MLAFVLVFTSRNFASFAVKYFKYLMRLAYVVYIVLWRCLQGIATLPTQ